MDPVVNIRTVLPSLLFHSFFYNDLLSCFVIICVRNISIIISNKSFEGRLNPQESEFVFRVDQHLSVAKSKSFFQISQRIYCILLKGIDARQMEEYFPISWVRLTGLNQLLLRFF